MQGVKTNQYLTVDDNAYHFLGKSQLLWPNSTLFGILKYQRVSLKNEQRAGLTFRDYGENPLIPLSFCIFYALSRLHGK